MFLTISSIQLLCRKLPPRTWRSATTASRGRDAAPALRQTRSAGTVTLFHAAGRCKSAGRVQDGQPSEFTGRLGSPTGLGQRAERVFLAKGTPFFTKGQTGRGPARARPRRPPPG